jgi:hypothetical protein
MDNAQKHNIYVKFLTWMLSHSSTTHLCCDIGKESDRTPVAQWAYLLIYTLVWESVSTEAWNICVLFR